MNPSSGLHFSSTEGYWVQRVPLTAVDILVPQSQTVFNLIPEILSISRRPESVHCLHHFRFSFSSIGRDTPSLNPCPVIRVQDTDRALSLLPENIRTSFSPPSVRSRHRDRFSVSRFGSEFTPTSTPTPVMLERDKSNSLRLLPDLFNISISPWFFNDPQTFSTSFSRLGKVLGRQPTLSQSYLQK